MDEGEIGAQRFDKVRLSIDFDALLVLLHARSDSGRSQLANHHASLPVAYQLYLPQDWADDRERRHKAGVSDRCRRRSGSQGGAGREHGCAATLQPLEIAPQNRQPQAPIRAIFGNSLS
jgi:hypothetical protein